MLCTYCMQQAIGVGNDGGDEVVLLHAPPLLESKILTFIGAARRELDCRLVLGDANCTCP